MTVTFSMGCCKESPRIDGATEPYPGSWIYYVIVGSTEEIDGKLMDWIREVAIFFVGKRYAMENEKVFVMPFAKVYPMLIAKAECKGRTKNEALEVTEWLTDYSRHRSKR